MKGQLSILDKNGDTRVSWDTTDPDSIIKAQAIFDSFKDKQYFAYGGTPGNEEIMNDFDPETSNVVLHRPVVGG